MRATSLRLSVFLCGCFVFVLSTQAQQQQAELTKEQAHAEAAVNEAMKAGHEALAAKDCPRAIASFQTAIEHSQAKVLDAKRRGAIQESALKEIADCQFAAKKLAEAEATLLRRKKVLLELGGPLEIGVAHNSLELAAVQIERQRFTEAERSAREAIGIYDAIIARTRKSAQPGEAAEATADITRSKVTGLYMLGLSLALQRKPDAALKIWDDGYRLGVQFEAKPETLEQMVIQAIEVHDMLNLTAQRRLWVERLRALRSAEKPKSN